MLSDPIHSWLYQLSNYCILYMGKSVHVHDCLLHMCITRPRCLAFVETGVSFFVVPSMANRSSAVWRYIATDEGKYRL